MRSFILGSGSVKSQASLQRSMGTYLEMMSEMQQRGEDISTRMCAAVEFLRLWVDSTILIGDRAQLTGVSLSSEAPHLSRSFCKLSGSLRLLEYESVNHLMFQHCSICIHYVYFRFI